MPEIGFFELYPAMRPLLPAGSYVLGADHELRATPLNNAPGDLTVDGTDFTLKIISPRYVMPTNQILSTFPPASAVGDWRQRLPQIVFKRRTMPWERDADTVAPKFATDPNARPPWLALVVLAEAEGTLSAQVPIGECVTPGTKMPDDNDTSVGKYLEVPKSTVERIFPTVADLQLLAHVRKVNLEDTELALGDDDGFLSVIVSNRLPQPGPQIVPLGPPDPSAIAQFESRRYTAYLINVEGQLHNLPSLELSDPEFVWHIPELAVATLQTVAPNEPVDVIAMHGLANLQSLTGVHAIGPHAASPALTTPSSRIVERARAVGVEAAAASFATGPVGGFASSADDNAAALQFVTGTPLDVLGGLAVFIDPTFRFPVLASWEFVCAGEGTFESIMNDLDTGMLGTFSDDVAAELRPTVAETGHILLEQKTRRGESAQAWYRGPFVPQPTVRTVPDPVTNLLPVAHAGDQLRRVVPDGHEDLGRASAFEIGRLLALSRPTVVAALMHWRQELFGAARVTKLGGDFVDQLIAGFSLAVALKTAALEDLLATHISVRYAPRLAIDLPRSQDFAVARRPDTIGALEARGFLHGLAIDPASVTRNVEAHGLAGLAAVEVRAAARDRGPLSGSFDLDGLRGTLDAHIESVATQSATKRRGRVRADALDRFIDVATEAAASADPRSSGVR